MDVGDDGWTQKVVDWLAGMPAGTPVRWWSSDIPAERGWAWRVVGVRCSRVEIDVGPPPLGESVWVVHAPWDDVADLDPYRMRAEPDLCAWCLFDELRRGLVALEAAPVGEPLAGDALDRLTASADGLAMWHVSGAPAWSPDAISAALTSWAEVSGAGPAAFVWDPGLAPPPDDPHPMAFGLVTIDPAIQRGAPCITGTRIPVIVIAQPAPAGWSVVDILSDYPDLTGADVDAAVAWQEEMGPLQFPALAEDAEDGDDWDGDDGDDDDGDDRVGPD